MRGNAYLNRSPARGSSLIAWLSAGARWLRWLPGAVLGVFAARVLGQAVGLPGVWAAVVLSVALGAAGAWLLARWPLTRTWPALLLLGYLAQMEPRGVLYTWPAALAAFVLNEGLRWVEGRRLGRWPPAVGAALFVGFVALYVWTLAPDVLPADSGELQTVAAQLGVAHPPGFPLYVILAHLMTRLPLVTPGYAVNLLSALVGAATVAVVYGAGWRLTGRLLPAVIGTVALGTATTFWSQATTANVRSLTALFAALVVYGAISFRIATRTASTGALSPSDASRPPTDAYEHPQPPPSGASADRWLIFTALFMGLGLTHHPSLIFLIAVALIAIILSDPLLLRTPRRWWRPLLAALLGCLPLLYLPLRAAADVRGASPALATLPGFLEHALATGFRGDLFAYLAPAELLPRLLIMANVMTFQFAPLLLAGMVTGLAWLLWQERILALLLGGSFVAYVFVAATYRAPQTVEYMMPAYVPAALLLAVSVAALMTPTLRGGANVASPLSPGNRSRVVRRPSAAGILALSLALVAALGQLTNSSASGARHEGRDARDYAGHLLGNAPADAVILAHWHWATPLWYLQEIEGQRLDVDVRFVFPEGEPYDMTWSRRTAGAFAEGRPVVTTWLPAAPLPDLPVPEPLGEAILYSQIPREGLPDGFEPVAVALDGGIEVLGYRFEGPTFMPGEERAVTVAWRPANGLKPGDMLFLHLVGPDGRLLAQDDAPALAAAGVTLTQFRLTPLLDAPAGADVAGYLGLSSAAGARQPLFAGAIVPANQPVLTRNPVRRAPAELNTGPGTLLGYDWDHTLDGRARLYLHWRGDTSERRQWTQVVDDEAIDALDLPPYRGPWGVPVRVWRFPRGRDGGHYVPLGQGIVWTGGTLNGLTPAAGESLTLREEFRSSRPVNRDYVVSVRLIGLELDGVHWAWWDLNDSIPALGAIPTLKWIEGSIVRSPHRLTVAQDAPPGQTLTGALTLYDAFTGRPLPILDERITAAQPWIPLCSAEVAE